MSYEVQNPAPVRIEIDGDVLVSDEEFCALVLAGIHRRTARRYEREGLPFVMWAARSFDPRPGAGLVGRTHSIAQGAAAATALVVSERFAHRRLTLDETLALCAPS